MSYLISYKNFLFNIFLIIIPFNFIIDFLYYFEGSLSIVSLARIIINTLFIFLYFILYSRKLNNYFFILYIILFYWAFLLLFSSDIIYSILEYIKVASAILFFPIACSLIDSKSKFDLFIQSNYLILILYVIFVFLANKFGIGDISYSNEDSDVFKVALGDAKLYAPAFLVGLIPFFINKGILRNKYFWALVGIVCLVILLITIRRTVVVIVFSLPILFQLFKGKITKLLGFLLTISLIILVSFPLIEEQFEERLKERDYLTDSSYSYEQEGRYVELFLVLNTFNEKGSVFTNYLFGREAFNTIGNYGFFRDRPIHVDYTYIFFSSGAVGLLLYLYFFKRIFNYARSFKNYIDTDYYTQFCVIFILVLFVGLSGNVWAITYKTFSFTLLGAFCGFLKSNSITND